MQLGPEDQHRHTIIWCAVGDDRAAHRAGDRVSITSWVFILR
jgi:hypothetical protein